MHTKKGLEHFVGLNAKAGKNYSYQAVSTFAEINASSNILMEKLPNGVTRVQMPRDSWVNAKRFSKSAIDGPNGEKLKGIKTLWPESFNIADIAEAAEVVLTQNSGSQDIVLQGLYKNIKVTVMRNRQNMKVKTVFPDWVQ